MILLTRWRPVWVETVVSLAAAAFSIVLAVQSLPVGPAAIATVGVLVAHVGALLRRAAPVAAFVAVLCGVGATAVATGLFVILPSVLTFPVVVLAVAADAWGRGRAYVLVAAALAAVVGTWRFVTDGSVRAQGLEPAPVLVLALFWAVLLAAWSLGLRVRADRILVRALADRAQERAAAAALTERVRIAGEMHDVIAHSLAAVVSQAKGGQYAGRTDPTAAIRALETIERAGREAAQEMRGLLGLLDGRAEPTYGPAPTLADLHRLVERFGSARLVQTGEPWPLPPTAQLAVYRLVQEPLTNVAKHAGEGVGATVSLAWAPDDLTVSVRDNGGGDRRSGGMPDTARTAEGAGRGIAGMQERVATLGGSLRAGNHPDGGFEVLARIPRRSTGAR